MHHAAGCYVPSIGWLLEGAGGIRDKARHSSRKPKSRSPALISLILYSVVVQLGHPTSRPVPDPPRLIVHLVIDQLRPDYLERWRGEFRGGLARLLREGVFYPLAEQDHAMTSTAPSHSTMLSGRSPASTGILTNDLGVPDRAAPLIGSTAMGASPRRFRGTTLVDWMLARDPATRVFSVSRKDRGAILTIGRARVPIFWYSQGRFTTSRYYADSLPTWLQEWNASDPVGRLAGHAWSLGRSPASYPEADNRLFERGGSSTTFPHRLPTERAAAALDLEAHTLMDSLTLDVAWRGFEAYALGRRNGTDLLAVSLSATDDIGHRYGPGSREVHDHLLNVDRWLGAFLDSLATVIPRDRMIVTLTADHGVTEFPEAGVGGRVSLSAEVAALNASGRDRWRIALEAAAYTGLLVARVDDLSARGVDIDSLASAVAARLQGRAGVRRVFTPRTLSRARDVEAMRWKRQIHADVEWVVAVSLLDGYVWGSAPSETSHGTTNVDDRRVPLIVVAPGVRPSRSLRVVRTIDIGPTLAALIGVRPTEPVEGAVLSEIHPRRNPR